VGYLREQVYLQSSPALNAAGGHLVSAQKKPDLASNLRFYPTDWRDLIRFVFKERSAANQVGQLGLGLV
jgi:hypothetical protein